MTPENAYDFPQTDLRTDADYREMPYDRGFTWTLFSFKGRIPRRTYWGVGLVMGLTILMSMLLLMALFGPKSGAVSAGLLLLYIPTIWISLAVQIKRWHDRGKSGAWVLINFIPYIGAIWSFIELGCLRGTDGPNEYGHDPT